MFKILWLLLIVAVLGFGVGWAFDDYGSVAIKWFGYEVRMDVLTAVFAVFLLGVVVFLVAWVLARILSWRFGGVFKSWSKARHLKRLEMIIKRQGKAFDDLERILTFIDVGDVKDAKKLRQKFGDLVKNKRMNEYLDRKLGLFGEGKKGWWRFW